MQTAHILVSLAGDHGNSVYKRNVPVSEIAVLRAIHGPESVQDVEPAGEIEMRSHRSEIDRLLSIYGKAGPDGKDASAVSDLYPGAAARVFEDLAELELPKEFYRAVTRAEAPAPTARKPAGKKAAAKAAADEGDGIGEMNDGILG